MNVLNQRQVDAPETLKRRVTILVKFPEDWLEAVVVQWDRLPPTVLIQMKQDPNEPLAFPGQRPHVPGNSDLPQDQPSALDLPLSDFTDPLTGKTYGDYAFKADILVSRRAFSALQPEADMVLPMDSMLECRREALNATSIPDMPGLERVRSGEF